MISFQHIILFVLFPIQCKSKCIKHCNPIHKHLGKCLSILKSESDLFAGKYELDMVLDIHAHTALTGLFVYGNSYDDVYRSFLLKLIRAF